MLLLILILYYEQLSLLLQNAAKIGNIYFMANGCNVATQSQISLSSQPETEIMSSDNTSRSTSPIAAMFDRISPRYDFLNHLLSLNIDKIWRRKTVKAVARNNPKNILDLATGTADLALELAKSLPEAHITGLDLSGKMLAIGEEKIKQQGLGNQISLQQGDAAHLPFANDTFDAITIAFGTRNFEDLPNSLSEIHRVMKADGSLHILEFSMPTAFPIKQAYNLYFKYILPKIGSWISKDNKAYSYLPTSVQNFPTPDTFINILGNSGFRLIEKKALSFGIATLYSAIK